MNEARTVDWDLSGSHRLEDVGISEDGDGAKLTPVADVASAEIEFPGGRTFTGGEEIDGIWLESIEGTIHLVRIDFDRETLDDAVERARELSRGWDIPVDRIDEWYERERSRSDGEPLEDALRAAGPSIGSENARPVVEIRYSFNEERPAIVSLSVVWLATDE